MKKRIRCSQCDEEFNEGKDYRLHWEETHFYPYLSKNDFDIEQAKKDSKIGQERKRP